MTQTYSGVGYRRSRQDCFDALPEAFRTVLVARLIEGMSIEETAELIGIKPETVKTRLHRARTLLKQEMEKHVGPVMGDAFPFAGTPLRVAPGR